ncbi:response regulator [Celeribacter marinus]|uniref:response regulator n=1 Tax=Celeribacter marinus TaxID=1397108 RepID=UPI00316F16D4
MKDSAILVLEDNALVGLTIEQTLQTEGYGKVCLCSTEEESLTAIESHDIQFGFLDYNLGQSQNSQCVAKRLADLGVPFVFLSGYTVSTGIIPVGMGEVGRVTKPAKKKDLLAYLKAYKAKAAEEQ